MILYYAICGMVAVVSAIAAAAWTGWSAGLRHGKREAYDDIAVKGLTAYAEGYRDGKNNRRRRDTTRVEACVEARDTKETQS